MFSHALFAVGALLSLSSVAPPIVSAQSTTATCVAGFDWATNSRGQNPCLVAAYVQGACNNGQFTVDPLALNTHYIGPTFAEQNDCQCSTIVYSLVSACANCQNRTYITWSTWSKNCTIQTYDSIFQEPIPSGTSIPAWAYLDVVTSDTFNPLLAQADASQPESSATRPAPSTTSVPSSSTFSSGSGSVIGAPTNTPNSAPTKKKSNAGAIAGGVVGGVLGLGLIAGLIAFFARRGNNSGKVPPSAAYANSEAPLNSPPVMSQQPSYAGAPYGPPSNGGGYPAQAPYGGRESRLYDPADPSTYPQAPPTPTINTTNTHSGPYNGHVQQPGAYSGVPEL